MTELKTITRNDIKCPTHLHVAGTLVTEEMAQAIQTLQAAEDRRSLTQVKLEHAGEFMAEIRELTDAGFNVALEPFATSLKEAEAQLDKAHDDFNAAEKSLSEAHGQVAKAFERLQHLFSPSPEAVDLQASPALSQQLPGVAESPTPSTPTTSTHSDHVSQPNAVISTPVRVSTSSSANVNAFTPTQSRAATIIRTPGTPVSNIRPGSVISMMPTASPSEDSACATAKALSSNYEHWLMKKFQHEADATRSYNECEAGGILELLRPLPHSREIFIIAEGSLPGVYVTRLSLMIEGLDWRGGRVVSFVGTYQDAKSLFQEWDSSGQTRVLTGDISRLAIDGNNEAVGDDGSSLYEEFGLDSVTILSDNEDLNESAA
ncbi:hypothetical protein FB446DRAFT_794451 [Lentinula raphanica]|nr:hypothetical protein FB446DRAFT_794451 [Lentinula raphanica]